MALDDLRNLVALDLFEPNDLLTLSSAKYQKGTRLAGVGWSRHWFRSGVTALATHHETLLKAMQAVQSANPDYVFYLLAGHTAAQPDTRTTRHRRLWKSLASSGLAISPNRQSSGECQPDREDGLRFFGFTQVSLNDCAAVLEVLKAEPISHLVALPIGCGGTPASLIRSGWARNENHRPSPEVTTAVAEAGGGTFWLVGKFDDPEYGTVFVSSAEIVAGVANLTA